VNAKRLISWLMLLLNLGMMVVALQSAWSTQHRIEELTRSAELVRSSGETLVTTKMPSAPAGMGELLTEANNLAATSMDGAIESAKTMHRSAVFVAVFAGINTGVIFWYWRKL